MTNRVFPMLFLGTVLMFRICLYVKLMIDCTTKYK
jgi:hypothetical protein